MSDKCESCERRDVKARYDATCEGLKQLLADCKEKASEARAYLAFCTHCDSSTTEDYLNKVEHYGNLIDRVKHQLFLLGREAYRAGVCIDIEG